MKKFKIRISSEVDIPAVLSEALSNMPSLRVSPEVWASLLGTMGVAFKGNYLTTRLFQRADLAARNVIEIAVPEEGNLLLRRAGWSYSNDHKMAQFSTPDWEWVTIMPFFSEETGSSTSEIELTVDFGRDSKNLAFFVLADISRRVPGICLLVEEAAVARAKEYRQLQLVKELH